MSNCYSIARFRLSSGGIDCNIQVASGRAVLIVSNRHYSLDVDTTTNRGFVITRWTITMTVGSPITAEKLNSRSPSASTVCPDQISAFTDVDTLVRSRVVAVGIPTAWIATPRIGGVWILDPEDGVAGASTSGNFDNTVCNGFFVEGPPTLGRYNGRRTTKPGYFPFCGSLNALFKKTGGGAYELTSRPMFLNDTWFSDRSAWKNGSSQNDAWSIQLFGEPAAAVTPNQFLALGVG